MIYELENGSYDVNCHHDPDLRCCISCQETAAKRFVYQNIPRSKWPIWLQSKFLDITKEQVIKEIGDYKKSPQRTNALLEQILNKLRDFPF